MLFLSAKGDLRHSHQPTLPNKTPAPRQMRHHRPYRSLLATLASSLPGLRPHALLTILSVFFAAVATAVQDTPIGTGYSLLLDPRSPPIPPLFMPSVDGHDDDDDNDDDASASFYPPSRRSITADASGSKADFELPKPLDTGLSSNFTSSCASFLNRMRNSDDVTNCHPFSLMLQTSSGFFDASKSVLRITQTLDATCSANATQCRSTLDNYARELNTATACKTDYSNNNPLVLQVYNGLVAYGPSYQASCLKDGQGNYCFANAVSNTSSPTDSYAYYLPIGQQMPGGSRPTCNSCLQQAMAIFSHYASNATQPISKTYTSAAQQLSISCGSTFVNVTAAPLKGAAAPTSSVTITPTMTLLDRKSVV